MVDVVLIQGNVELALNFGGRAFRDEQELDEFFAASPGKAFGDIGHGRDRCGLQLVDQPEVLSEFSVRANRFVDQADELSGLLPGLYFFETG
jgi:hypothetical protein